MSNGPTMTASGGERPETPQPHGGSRPLVRVATAIVVAAGLETLVLALALRSDVPLWVPLALHLVQIIIVALILFARREQGCDLALACVILMLLAVAGPAGALPLLAFLPFLKRSRAHDDAVAAWYERLAKAGKPSAISQTYERIVSGRVQRLGSAPPVNFLDVIHRGGLEERQRALGLIARRFHPDYTPVLAAALRSPEPVVRVQAAAVVARVREDLKTRVGLLAQDHPQSLRRTLAGAGELSALQSCDLISEPLQAVSRDAARRLMRKALAKTADLTRLAANSDRDTRAAVEDYLISEMRFGDLRVWRRAVRVTCRSLRVIRRRRARLEQAA